MTVHRFFTPAVALLGTALTIGTVIAPQAQATDRRVLFEKFTATWCSHCPSVGRALHQLHADYPDDMIILDVHRSDEYETLYGDDRAIFYGVFPLPDVRIDGVIAQVGGNDDDQVNYDNLLGALNTRMPVPTDVTIELSVAEVSGQTYRLTAEVGVEAGGSAKTVRVHMVQALDDFPEATDNRYTNTLRVGHEMGDYALTPGSTQIVEQEFDLTADWGDKDDIRFIVWAQESASSGPAEVYNSAIWSWPTCIGDLDGDGDTDQSDLGILLASYTINDAGDLDGDGDTDQSDLGILLAFYGCG
ncbi:MAG: thioredoxin family protein [Phycisphaerales bacterium]|nr:thioredoxin family protein [Phycisphaerales bacterium]